MISKQSSLEAHVARTKQLVSAAENFISGAEDADALRSSAEDFVTSAENHLAAAETMVSASENHLVHLKKVASTAENSAQKVSRFLGAEDKVPKKSR